MALSLKMLKLLLFIPCEKIINSDTNLVSVVNILDTVNANPHQEVVKEAVIPFVWEIFTLWHKTESEDNNKSFEQRIELFRPDKISAFSVITDFPVDEDAATYRVINKIGAFPVGVTGVVRLVLSIREVGDGNEWKEMVSYPLNVLHNNKGVDYVEREIENEPSIKSV